MGPVQRRGKIFGYSIYHRVYDPSFKDDVPYVVAVAELEEGPRLLSNVVDCNVEDVHCDMPIEVVFRDVTEEATLYYFRPVSGR